MLNNENTWTQGGEHHTLQSVVGSQERDSSGWGGWGGITRREILDIGDGEMKAANHLAMYVPMQQSCMICTSTPEPKIQLKIKEFKMLYSCL